MATTSECYLCNPDAGRDCLCPACMDKASGYDLLHLNLTLAGLALRRLKQTILLDMPALKFAGQDDKGSYYIDRIDALLDDKFADVLAEYDAQKKREAEFARQAQAATLHPSEVETCAEIDKLATRIGQSGGMQI